MQQDNPIKTPEELEFLNRKVELKDTIVEATHKAIDAIAAEWDKATEHFTDGMGDGTAAFVQGELDSVRSSLFKFAAGWAVIAEEYIKLITLEPLMTPEEEAADLPY